jgi:glutamine amidotransferase PdxT
MNVWLINIGRTWLLQLNSFETQLPVPALVSEEGGPSSFRAVFIRAPAITEAGPSVEVLAEYTVPSNFQASSLDQVISILPFWNIARQNAVDPKQFLKFTAWW